MKEEIKPQITVGGIVRWVDAKAVELTPAEKDRAGELFNPKPVPVTPTLKDYYSDEAIAARVKKLQEKN